MAEAMAEAQRKLRLASKGVALGIAAISSTVAFAGSPEVAVLPGKPAIFASAYDVAPLGYSVEEFTLDGVAQSYLPKGKFSADGNWQVTPGEAATYKTRLVVMRPTDRAKFNGSVVVEWMNVSGGLDVPVAWINSHKEFLRKGYAYVAVSAQKVGIDGGLGRAEGGGGNPLKRADPERYGNLLHPGDAYSYDIFSDVARILRSRQVATVLGPLVPQRLLAVGESQSAIYLATYVNAIDPLARVYDGFLIHSRSAIAAPLDSSSMFAAPAERMQQVARLRPNLRVPVIQLVTETDLIQLVNSVGFHAARQPDNAHLRTWEVAGSAHADNYLFSVGMMDAPGISIEKLAAAWAPISAIRGHQLAKSMNNGPQHHYVGQAAIAQLDRWVETGRPAAAAEQLQLKAGSPPSLVLDPLGNAVGGVRTPWVDAPTSRLTGDPRGAAGDLFGAVEPFDSEVLRKLYPNGAGDYLRAFGLSLDRAIRDGFILDEDRAEILALARTTFPAQ